MDASHFRSSLLHPLSVRLVTVPDFASSVLPNMHWPFVSQTRFAKILFSSLFGRDLISIQGQRVRLCGTLTLMSARMCSCRSYQSWVKIFGLTTRTDLPPACLVDGGCSSVHIRCSIAGSMRCSPVGEGPVCPLRTAIPCNDSTSTARHRSFLTKPATYFKERSICMPELARGPGASRHTNENHDSRFSGHPGNTGICFWDRSGR